MLAYPSAAEPRLVVPLAGDHSQRVVAHCAEVVDHVVSAVDVDKSLVEGNVEHGQLVVVAEHALQERLVAEGQLGEVVVGAVDEEQLRAVVNGQRRQVVVGAYQVEQCSAVAHRETLHVVVGADERAESGEAADNHVGDFIVVDIEVLQVLKQFRCRSMPAVIWK